MNDKMVKSADRILDLLEYLSAQPSPVALREVVRILGFPKSSTHALLNTLVYRGYVRRVDLDRYEVVPAFKDRFSWVGGFESQLIAISTPILEKARELTGETAILAVRRPSGDAAVIAKAVSRHPIRYDADHTKPLPGYATVMGRVLLAYWDEAAVNAYFKRTALKPFTPKSLIDEASIRAVLEEIRERGYGIIEEEFDSGGCGIAFPIFDAVGCCVATFDIAAVTQRFASAHDKIRETGAEAAATISRRLGYRAADIKEVG